jgi:hypothetical protein
LLCIVAPAGLEDVFRQIGIPTTGSAFLPASAPDPGRAALMKEVAGQYGLEFFPPDYFDEQKAQ